ncbi:hypothetical protein HQ590_01215 [bacterium]|nr:hypothetical protein [bacterium]
MLQLTTFRADVTPPVGHPLCGGWWEQAAVAIDDPLFALGVVLLPDDQSPVVLGALDWCEISHADHRLWRQQLAAAAGTTPDRVAVHCTHSHEAPWPDRAAHALANAVDPDTRVMIREFCDAAIDRGAMAIRDRLPRRQPLTHLGLGTAVVEQVASNRRIHGPDGKVQAVRWTATKDPAVRAEPEGLIDPVLRTISFWNGAQKLAALHYYAVHPNSYGGIGRVTKDFAGIAREDYQLDDPAALHVYFTGGSGNVTAGKYNDGAPENRAVLADRICAALVASEKQVEQIPVDGLEWRTAGVALPAREDLQEAALLQEINDPSTRPIPRIKAAMKLVYLRQTQAQDPTLLSALHLAGKVSIVHLPGEPFIEYQLFAQEQRPDRFVAVAGYGDCGPGYICLARSPAEGGYEPEDSFCSPDSEPILKDAITALLR